MKKYAPVFGLYLLLYLTLIFEGLGIRDGRIITRYIIYLAPFALYGIDYWNSKEIVIPFKLSILFIFFLIGTSLSTLNAANVQFAFEHQLYYISVALICLYAMNHKNEIIRYIPHFFWLSTATVLVYALFINMFLPDLWAELIPISGFQFVYVNEHLLSHHPIGAYILIPLTYLYIQIRQKSQKITAVTAISLFFILAASFLRSAYVAFLTVIVYDLISIRKERKGLSLIHTSVILGIGFLLSTVFLSITTFSTDIHFFTQINNRLQSSFPLLSNKSLDNSRTEFISQSYQALSEDPLIGVGSFNYYYASQKHASSYVETTGTSHNLFLDIWVENGFVAFSAFIGILFFFFLSFRIHAKNYSNEQYRLYMIFISLLILFQLGHYHKMYFMLILFFTLFALLYNEEKKLTDNYAVLFKGTAIVAVIGLLMIASHILNMRGNYLSAVLVYPISLESNLRLLYQYRDHEEILRADIQAEKIGSLYPKEPDVLEILGDYYRGQNHRENALYYYSSALSFSPHDFSLIKNTYEELSALSGKEQADTFIRNYFTEFEIRKRNPPYEMHLWFYDWCKDTMVPCSEG